MSQYLMKSYIYFIRRFRLNPFVTIYYATERRPRLLVHCVAQPPIAQPSARVSTRGEKSRLYLLYGRCSNWDGRPVHHAVRGVLILTGVGCASRLRTGTAPNRHILIIPIVLGFVSDKISSLKSSMSLLKAVPLLSIVILFGLASYAAGSMYPDESYGSYNIDNECTNVQEACNHNNWQVYQQDAIYVWVRCGICNVCAKWLLDPKNPKNPK
jgi:hypothetical protein